MTTLTDDDARRGGIAVRALTKSFVSRKTTTTALRDVELRVDRGQFLAIIGPSGCGKSTLLRVLAGLVEADRGSVSIFGEDVAEARSRKEIGLVAQTPALLPWRSVLDNVTLPLELNRRAPGVAARDLPEPRELLEAFGLGSAVDRRPDQLSGGMRQRVAIARAFAFRPSLLLMDEPFSALDELTREVARSELLDVWQRFGTTVVFVTHSVTEAVILADAVVVMAGPPGEVVARLEVPLPRPRDEGVELSVECRTLEADVRALLREGWRRGGA